MFFTICLPFSSISQNPEKDKKYQYARNLLEEGIRDKDSIKIAEAYYLQGKIEFRSGNNPTKAYELYYKSLKISEQSRNHYQTAKTYLRLAELELLLKNTEAARTFLKEARSVLENNKMEREGDEASLLLVELYRLTGHTFITPSQTLPRNKLQYDSALHYFRKMEQVAALIKTENALMGAKFELGHVYASKNDKRAIHYLEEAVKMKSEFEPDSPLINYRTNLSNAYFRFNNIPKAKEVLEGSQKIIDAGKYNISQQALSLHYKNYARYYKATGDYKNALHYTEQAQKYIQIMGESDRDGNMTQWRARLETEKKTWSSGYQKQEIE
ncbi:MAG: tetratricopeptide repeat protein, partial [Leadbetterella sp.]|nr:tetratricopeptide repeat protein [Leadbetterella sp.]